MPNDGQWHLLYLDVSVHGDTTQATCQVEFAASGVYDIDAFSARDVAAFTGTTTAAYRMDYLRGTDFERYLTAEEVCDAGTAAADSASLYGRREAVVSNPDIIAWNADAIAWAKAYFERAAVLLSRPRVELLHESAQAPSPGEASLIRISGSGNDIPDAFLSRAAYAWTDSRLAVSLEMTSERPTLAKILKSLSVNGSGSASSIAAVAQAGAASGAGSGGIANPIPVSVLTRDDFAASGAAYTLTQVYDGKSALLVFGDGVLQLDYAFAGGAVTLGSSVNPASFQRVSVVYSTSPAVAM